MAQAIENVELAKRYKPLTKPQLKALLARGKELAKTIGPRYGPVVLRRQGQRFGFPDRHAAHVGTAYGNG